MAHVFRSQWASWAEVLPVQLAAAPIPKALEGAALVHRVSQGALTLCPGRPTERVISHPSLGSFQTSRHAHWLCGLPEDSEGGSGGQS